MLVLQHEHATSWARRRELDAFDRDTVGIDRVERAGPGPVTARNVHRVRPGHDPGRGEPPVDRLDVVHLDRKMHVAVVAGPRRHRHAGGLHVLEQLEKPAVAELELGEAQADRSQADDRVEYLRGPLAAFANREPEEPVVEGQRPVQIATRH